ncbi:MAG: hypothetical protein LBF21_01460 [Puniceicoccales bacterium]|jgi:hypothetical protein|nr:hypothetical protein [Puniceicoccales bacterium]
MDGPSISSLRNPTVEAGHSPASGATPSALAKHSVARGPSGSGQVTTLRQLRQSETAAFAGDHAPLGEHRAQPLSAEELPAALKQLFGRPENLS